MEITFLGVGEAFDENFANTSILVRARSGGKLATILLDCGYSAPPKFWQRGLGPEALDAIWISHFHADHAFGLPSILVRFWEEGRRGDLHILGQKGIESFVLNCLDLAYPNFYTRLPFVLRFKEVEPGEPATALGLSWNAGTNDHSQRNLALRLDAESKSLFYSGDGRPTTETRKLAKNADLIVHEAFKLDEVVYGHGTVAHCIEMARLCRPRILALVHLHRQTRRTRLDEIKRMAESVPTIQVIIPEPGDKLAI